MDKAGHEFFHCCQLNGQHPQRAHSVHLLGQGVGSGGEY